MKYFSILLPLVLFSSACTTEEGPAYTNALINESSPYLLQHAHNPVDWYPWKEEALNKAKAENKLLLISIGYAACHWCHVMEEESFQDTSVANLMNRYFVSIKVDREERPDVDDVYMTACQLAGGGSCGWPLNAIALPDGRPVWAGTYFPKKQWVDILKYFIEIKDTESEKLEGYAKRLIDGIAESEEIPVLKSQSNLSKGNIRSVTDTLLNIIDFKEGGIQSDIKFPMPGAFSYLLSYHHFSKDKKALDAVLLSLQKMARGGIYDQLGGGFARYSTDRYWRVPHFEKMLYDNGQLLSLYAQAYQVRQDSLFEQVIRQTIDFAERELSHPEGAFYSSINADSEGEEGTFYIWTSTEIDDKLTDPLEKQLIKEYFGITEKGNWEEGKNVLAVQTSISNLSEAYNLSPSDIREKLDRAQKLLFEAREKRVRPSLDDKVLASWNALMIKGYLDAYQALREPTYLQRALQAATFLSEKMLKTDGRLDRNFKSGTSSINAFLDDYALSIRAFLALYEQTFDLQWLEKAGLMTDYVLTHFQDPASALFYYTSDEDPPLVSRKKELADNVIPASNSVMARNLYQLGLLQYDTSLIKQSENMLSSILPQMEAANDPIYFANWAQLYLEQLIPPFEVVVIGPDFAVKKDSLLSHYLPNTLLLGGAEENDLPLLKNKYQEGKTMIYVCQNKVCKLPVQTVKEAIGQLK